MRQYPELCDSIDNNFNISDPAPKEKEIISQYKVNTHAFEIIRKNGRTIHRFRTDLCQFNTTLKYDFPVSAFKKGDLLDLQVY